MLKKWLAKNGIQSIDDGARSAHERGDTTFTYRFHPSPFKAVKDSEVNGAINRVEVLGWKLHSRELEGLGLERCWNLTFARR
ncbi:hypothetical protein ACF06X_14860 [Streptomyces sp. NPDC015346]|uniref:hypothetical protein n=1 Tax=Streptomyces sp. NPDC015346 TaxID=3364954 RepID=UPI0037012A0A